MSRPARIQPVPGVSQVARGSSIRLRWRFGGDGADMSTTVKTPAEAYTAALKIKSLDYRVTGRDAAVRDGSLWTAAVPASDAPVAPKTFEALAREVLAERVRVGRTEQRTADQHRSRIRRMPWRGASVADITADEVNAWITTERRAKRLAASTAAQYVITVSMVLKAAERRRMRLDDGTRADLVSPSPRKRIGYLSHDEVADVVAATDEAMFADLFQVLAYTGARIGEALGWTVADVDIRNRIVTVRGTVIGSKSDDEWSDGKSHNAGRDIPIYDDETLAALVRRVDGRRGNVPLFAWGADGSPCARRFAGTRPSDEACRRRFRLALTAVGLKSSLRVHDLRHSHATWLRADGVPTKYIAERLGNTVAQVEKTYAHSDPWGVDAVAASINKRASAAASRKAPLQAVA